MSLLNRAGLLLLVSVFAVAGSARAATISLVTTPFASPAILETFDDGSIDPFFSITSNSGTQIVSGSGYAGNTPSPPLGLSTTSFPDTIKIAFANPVLAAGLYFGNDDHCCSSGFAASLDIFGLGGAFLGTVSVVANMNDFADQFLGFMSDTPVYTMAMRYGNGSNVALYPYIDNLQVGDTAPAVPEPATLLLLSAGMAAGIRHRFTRQQA